jgi:hypothetical protein
MLESWLHWFSRRTMVKNMIKIDVFLMIYKEIEIGNSKSV